MVRDREGAVRERRAGGAPRVALRRAVASWLSLGALLAADARGADPAPVEERPFERAALPSEGRAAAIAAAALAGEIRERAGALERVYEGPRREPVAGDDALEWWAAPAREPLVAPDATVPASLESCYDRALRHSTQLRVFADLPLIRETGIDEAEGLWTPRAFAEGKFERRNEPVGNVLTTGRDGRFREKNGALEAGVRKRFQTGGEATLAQRFDYLDNNSVFFEPNPQSNSRLVLSVVQPLLRGMGFSYNRSLYELARLDTDVAREEFVRQLESHLVELTRAYWALYLARAGHVQKAKLVEETGGLVGRLEARSGLDVERGSLLRARAALADREADLLRSRIGIENAGAKLRALMNDPELDRGRPVELVPADGPALSYGDVALRELVGSLVERRPEIRQALLQYEAAVVREGMARNEARQTLDLILEASLGGIGDDHSYGEAFSEEWEHSPGALVGLRYEMPVGNAEPQARLERRRRELRQQGNQVRTTLATLILEAEVAGAEYATAAAELDARRASLEAAVEDLELQRTRWQQGVGSASGVAFLEGLLDAQDRRAEAEARLVTAQVGYRIAVTNLERVQGRFLDVQAVEITERRPEGDELPSLELRRRD